MKKGSRSATPKVTNITLKEQAGGFVVLVVLKGPLPTRFDLAKIMREIAAQVPAVTFVSAPTPSGTMPVPRRAAKKRPAQSEPKAQAPNIVVQPKAPAETVDPPRTGTVPQANVTQAPDSETVQAPGDDPPDLPFDPERRPDAEAVHKRLRKTKGEEK